MKQKTNQPKKHYRRSRGGREERENKFNLKSDGLKTTQVGRQGSSHAGGLGWADIFGPKFVVGRINQNLPLVFNSRWCSSLNTY